MRLSARRLRRWSAACFVLAGVCVVLIAVSWLKPFATASGKMGLAMGRGVVGFVRGTDPIAADWPPGITYPLWTFTGTSSRAAMWVTSIWRPSTNDLSITVSSVPPMSISVLWVPLWNPVAAFVIAGMFLRWRASRHRGPGECKACGYDLAGLPPGACPECGKAIAG